MRLAVTILDADGSLHATANQNVDTDDEGRLLENEMVLVLPDLENTQVIVEVLP